MIQENLEEKTLVYSEDLFWNTIIKNVDFKNFRLPTIDEKTDNTLSRDYINDDTHYLLNSKNFRCDEFKKNHDGLHILFGGCSCTLGTGNDLENVWAYKLYNEIKKENKVSGYYNLGHKGGGIISIIHTILLYIENYGKPDVLFLLLPNAERDEKYFSDTEYTTFFVTIMMYKLLEMFCESNKIKLISTSWIIDDDKIDLMSSLKNKLSNKMYRKRKNQKHNDSYFLQLLQQNTKTFKLININLIDNLIFNYVKENKNSPNLYEAKDYGRHYGTAFNHAWMIYMLERFMEINND